MTPGAHARRHRHHRRHGHPNGNVAPGNSIGTLNITGNYTQATGSTYAPRSTPPRPISSTLPAPRRSRPAPGQRDGGARLLHARPPLHDPHRAGGVSRHLCDADRRCAIRRLPARLRSEQCLSRRHPERAVVPAGGADAERNGRRQRLAVAWRRQPDIRRRASARAPDSAARLRSAVRRNSRQHAWHAAGSEPLHPRFDPRPLAPIRRRPGFAVRAADRDVEFRRRRARLCGREPQAGAGHRPRAGRARRRRTFV